MSRKGRAPARSDTFTSGRVDRWDCKHVEAIEPQRSPPPRQRQSRSAQAKPHQAVATPEIKPSRGPSRRAKKTIAGFFDPAASGQLKQLALDEGSNVQDLLREAINDFFEKRGKAPIA
jgi:hypothetical protein